MTASADQFSRKVFCLIVFLQEVWKYLSRTLFSGVMRPLQPTSNDVRFGFILVISVNINVCFYFMVFSMLISCPAVSSQILTELCVISLITISGFSSLMANSGSRDHPVLAR